MLVVFKDLVWLTLRWDNNSFQAKLWQVRRLIVIVNIILVNINPIASICNNIVQKTFFTIRLHHKITIRYRILKKLCWLILVNCTNKAMCLFYYLASIFCRQSFASAFWRWAYENVEEYRNGWSLRSCKNHSLWQIW